MLFTKYLLNATDIILTDILKFERPADAILKYYFKQNEQLGTQDRNIIAESIYQVLRRKNYLSFFIERAELEVSARLLILTALIKLEGVAIKNLKDILKEPEVKMLEQIKAGSSTIKFDELPLHVQRDLPEWILEKIQPEFTPEALREFVQALNSPAPLDLRINTIKTSREVVMKALFKSKIEGATETPYSPYGIRLKEKVNISRHPMFLDGAIEVQDEGSQLIGMLVNPKRHEMVADFCAGAGGKTLVLGMMMRSQGRLYAFDVASKRLDNLKPRLKRSGLSNVHPQLMNNENDIKIKRLRRKIDRVLVDAPCTGLGTIRRNPDLKWRQNPESLAELTQKQLNILSSASELVKEGGRLVYATCSFLPDENEHVIARFLEKHADFEIIPVSKVFEELKIDALTTLSSDFMKLSPVEHQSDGFFGAVLTRKVTPKEEAK